MRFFLFIFCFVSLLSTFVQTAEIVKLDEAIKTAFPKADHIKRQTYYLDKAQLNSLKKHLNIEIPSRMFIYYEAILPGNAKGYLYLDTHRVRSLYETILISINTQNTIERIEVLSFEEPPEYMASERWLQQFYKQDMSNAVNSTKKIQAITGASLTSDAISESIIRVMAIHRLVNSQ